jgi:hypothetical protein
MNKNKWLILPKTIGDEFYNIKQELMLDMHNEVKNNQTSLSRYLSCSLLSINQKEGIMFQVFRDGLRSPLNTKEDLREVFANYSMVNEEYIE